MSSLPRLRIIRAAESAGDVFVLGQENRQLAGAESSVSDAMTLVRNAHERAAAIVAAAEQEARQLLAQAEQQAGTVLAQAHQQGRESGTAEGLAAGQSAAASQFAEYLEVVRKSAEEGRRVRDQVAGDAAP